MSKLWQEIPIDEYKKIISESVDDKDFRRRLKEWKPPSNPKVEDNEQS